MLALFYFWVSGKGEREMKYISKKVISRVSKNVPKFQRVLNTAFKRDINESDTVAIITDMLTQIFGYEKYVEVTSELAIRGTYCDLAVRANGKIVYLVECKAIGIALKDKHLKQAVDYGANKGIQWIILSNGLIWQVYRIRFEKPINYDLVFTLNFENMDLKSEKSIEMLSILCKEALLKNLRQDYFEKVQSVNRFIIGNLLLSDNIISLIRRELRKFAEGVRIDGDEIYHAIESDILKRDIVEGEEAESAKKRLKRFFKKTHKKKHKITQQEDSTEEKNISVAKPILSESD